MTKPVGTTRIEPFHGRDIALKELLPGQKVGLARLIRNLQRAEGTAQEIMANIAKVSDVLYSAIVKPEDQEFVEDLMLRGEVDLKELAILIRGEQDEEPVTPRARRGRPRKSVAA